MKMKEKTVEEILNEYGIDVSSFSKSSYHVNENTGMLVISDRSKIAFEGAIKPKDVIHGNFSDTYFHYFEKLKEEK